MKSIEMIEFIDEFLRDQEDVLHGIEGKNCTKSRKYLEDIKKQLLLHNVSGSLQSLQEWAKSEKDGQVEQIIVMTAFGNTIVVDLTSKSSIEEFCEWQ